MCAAIVLCFYLSACLPLAAQYRSPILPSQSVASQYTDKIQRPSSVFIENKGQWDVEARFLTRLNGMNVWITGKGLVYDVFQGQRDEGKGQMEKDHRASAPLSPIPSPSAPLHGHVVKMNFLGSKQTSRAEGMEKQTPYFNYFLGNDKSKWASNVPSFSETRIHGLYDGISARVYFDSGQVRYDMIVEPGADASQIALEFEGADDVFTNRNGELVLKTSVGELLHGKLYAYQVKNGRRVQISCRFTTKGTQQVAFALGEYDPALPLVIDPLVWSTYFGGAGQDYVSDIVLDASNNPVIAGYFFVNSAGFPTTAGAYKTTQTGNSCSFISKLSANGSSLIFSTYYGGTSAGSTNMIGANLPGFGPFTGGLAIDPAGNIYISGSTNDQTNFPLHNAYQTTHQGGPMRTFDGFVAKFDPTCTSLTYSTYLGGIGDDYAAYIAADNAGNAYIGATAGGSPTIPAGYTPDVSLNAGGFVGTTVIRLSPTGTVNYVLRNGATSGSDVQNIRVDANGYVYITGQAWGGAQPFYVTANCCQPNYNNSGDAFLMKINPVGAGASDVLYSTYLGGNGGEYFMSLRVDPNGLCYIAGRTQSTIGFPTTGNAFQSVNAGGDDGFIVVVNPNISGGAGLLYGTYIGTSDNEIVSDISVDANGLIHAVGRGEAQFPTTPGSLQPTFGGGTGDIYYLVLDRNRNGTAQLRYSTMLGGTSVENGIALKTDNTGAAIIASRIFNPGTLPTTAGAYRLTPRGSIDVGVSKITPIAEFPLRTGFGSSIEFDGTQRIQTQTSFARPLQWTVECWVRSPEAPSGTKTTYPFTHGSNAGMAIVWDHANPAFRGSVQVLLADGITFIPAKFGNLQGNTWYHLAATFDGRTLRAYQNGILTSQHSIPSALQANTTPVIMGFGASPLLRFRGTIDEARYWNTALPATTIARFAGQEIDPTHPNWSNLIGYWNFNTYEGLVATDISPNKNGATLLGMNGDASVPAEQDYSFMASPRSPSNLAPRILPSIGQLSSPFPVNLLLQGVNGGSPLANVTVNGQTLLYTPRTGAVQQGFTDRVSYRLAQERDTVSSSLAVRFLPEVESRTVYGLPNTPISLASGYTVFGGTTPLTYSWFPAAGLSSTSASAPSATLATNATYTLTVTDVLGFSASTSVSVNVNGPFYYISGDAAQRSSWNADPRGTAVAPLSLAARAEFIVPSPRAARLQSSLSLPSGTVLTIETGASVSIASDVILSNQGMVQIGGTLMLENNANLTGTPVRWLGSGAVLNYTGNQATASSNVEFPASMTIASVVVDNSGGVRLNGSKTLTTAFTLAAGAICNTSAATLRLAGEVNLAGRFADDSLGTLIMDGSGRVNGLLNITAPNSAGTSTAAAIGRLRTLSLNRAGLRLPLGAPLALTESLILTGATVIAPTANFLRLLGNGSTTVVSNGRQAFVEGAVQRVIPPRLAASPPQEFLFPVGQSAPMPFALVAPESGSEGAIIQAEAFNAAPPGTIGDGIIGVNNVGYWSTRLVSGSLAQSRVRITPVGTPTPLSSIARADAAGGAFTGVESVIGTTSILSVPLSGALFGGIFTVGFNEPPRISSFSPRTATSGTFVSIVGTNFTTNSHVRFGGVSADSVRFVSSRELQARVGAGASGNVEVETRFGTAVAEQQFRYLLPPTITDFTPISAPSGGRIVLRGTNFSDSAEVFFGGIAATSVSVESDSVLVAIVGSGTSGEVRLRTRSGTTTARAEFSFEGSPSITAFAERAVTTGGTLTIIGTNLWAARQIRVGGVVAEIVSVRGKQAVVRVPAGITVSQASVQVSTQFGQAMSAQNIRITPAVRIVVVAPRVGVPGTTLVLQGAGFLGVTTMTIAGIPALFSVDSDETLLATVGSIRSRGKIILAGSTRSAESTDDFLLAAPTITRFQPIAATSGTTITIIGTNFYGVTSVTVGGIQTSRFTVESPTRITAMTPIRERGSGLVTIQNDGGTASSVSLIANPFFTFVPTRTSTRSPRIFAFNPNGGGTGTRVLVSGENLDSALVGYAGGALAQRVESLSSTAAILTIGDGASGALQVLTANGVGTSTARFIYFTPREVDSLALQEAARVWALRTTNRSDERLNWRNDGLPMERWNGITLDNGRVVGIAVTGANLSGVLPDTLAQLTALRTLILERCNLSGGLPRFMENLSALEHLNLSNNQLSGTISTVLLQLPNLQTLNLSRNRFGGRFPIEPDTTQSGGKRTAARLQAISELSRLDLSGNELEGSIPAELRRFPFLRTLSLEGNRLTGAVPQELAGLMFLETLTLAGNRLSGLPNMTELRRLRVFSVERNRLDFAALEPNITLGSLTYIPQDSVGEAGQIVRVPLESRFSLRAGVGGSRNFYRWLKNGVEVRSVSQDSILPFAFFRPSDAGEYVCQMTSVRVPELTLTTHTITLQAAAPLAPREALRQQSPPNESRNVATTATLRWSGLPPSAEGNIRTVWYEVQIAADSTFDKQRIAATTASREIAANEIGQVALEGLRQYFWRVRAVNGGGAGVWSNVWRFTTSAGRAEVLLSVAPFPRTVIQERSHRAILLTNQSQRNITLESIALTQNTDNAFNLPILPVSQTLRPGGSTEATIEFAPRSTGGRKTAEVEVRFRVEGLPSAQTTSETLSAWAGIVQVKTTLPDTIIAQRRLASGMTLINRSRQPIIVEPMPSAPGDAFRFAESGKTAEQRLGIGDTTVIAYSVLAQEIGSIGGQLRLKAYNALHTEELDEAIPEFQLTARQETREDIRVRFAIRPTANNLAPGAEVRMNVVVDSGDIRKLFSVLPRTDWEVTVVTDRNVLVPLDGQDGVRVLRQSGGSGREIPFKITGQVNPARRVLAQFSCRVVAGDTDKTSIRLPSIVFRGDENGRVIFIEPSPDGLFQAAISRAGGKRLIKPTTGTVQILSVTPNPATNDVALTFRYAEELQGHPEVELVDILGQVVQRWSGAEGVLDTGEAKMLRLPMTYCPSGSYTLRLKIGSAFAVQRINILR